MDETPQSPPNPWIGFTIGFIFAIVAIVTAVFLYQEFNRMETEGGSALIPYPIMFLYDLGGKELVAGAFLLIFGFFSAMAFHEGLTSLLQRRRK